MSKSPLKILLLILFISLASCGKDSNIAGIAQDNLQQIEIDDNSEEQVDLALHTGDPELELKFVHGFIRKAVAIGQDYFVSVDRLRLRSSDNLKEDNIVGLLELNDVVKVVSAPSQTTLVEVEVVKTEKEIIASPTGKYFLSQKYLSKNKREKKSSDPSKYFMVQNIANERLRVYERNHDGGAHKLVFETEVVVGEHDRRKGLTNTVLGNFRISRWIKFYQDGAGNYPSWYHPSLPMPPGKNKGVMSWFRKKYMGKRGGSMRGAFGWYTAKITPRSYYQWTHGTIGWGESSHDFVKRTKKFWANVLSDPRSHGCTRTNNQAIAFIREILPVSTPIVKIYARETYEDPSRSRYNHQSEDWDYILTKHGSRKDGQKAARAGVLASNVGPSDILEEGTLRKDIFPNAYVTDDKKSNVYRISESKFKGKFYVDTGRVSGNYRHPRGLKVGGYKDEFLPSYMIKKQP